MLGTAYALYLLDHNVELQERLLNWLKDVGNFQGAYYELFVASTLIRAGFTLTLEDETDMTKKHCEFAAVSQRTGKKYWVEAKMRSDGRSRPTSRDRIVAQCFLDKVDLAEQMTRCGTACDWPKFSGGRYKISDTTCSRK